MEHSEIEEQIVHGLPFCNPLDIIVLAHPTRLKDIP